VHDPGVRLCDIATTLGMTERSAYCVVTELTVGGYVVKEKEEKDGRRNRYQIQAHLPLRGAINRERKIGEGWPSGRHEHSHMRTRRASLTLGREDPLAVARS